MGRGRWTLVLAVVAGLVSPALARASDEAPLRVSTSLRPLPPPVAGQPLLPRRADGLAPVGLDTATAIANGLDPVPVDRALSAGNLDLARIIAPWATIERERGTYDWSVSDSGYRAAVEAGVRPVVQVMTSPGWAVGYRSVGRDAGCTGEYCLQAPSDGALDRFAAFAAATARRYPLAAAIEVWNEPNLWIFWHAEQTDPAAYARLLGAAHDAIKRANPAMRVLGGALNNIETTGPPADDECGAEAGVAYSDCKTKQDIALGEFLDGLLRAGAADDMDALSFHPYPVTEDAATFVRTFATVRSVLARHGRTDLRLVASEVGVGGVDDRQATGLVDLVDAIAGRSTRLAIEGASRVDATLFFESVELGSGYGWLRRVGASLVPRASYCLMADRLGPRPPSCPGLERYVETVPAAPVRPRPARCRGTAAPSRRNRAVRARRCRDRFGLPAPQPPGATLR